MPQQKVSVGNVDFGNTLPFSLICGPCAMESRDHAFEMADALAAICRKLDIGLVYKSSFDKANRTSVDSKRGIGLEKTLDVFGELKDKYGFPVVTDIHESWQCKPVAEVVDLLQIPAFLCRQTDLLIAAAATGRAIKVKKGQFLAPADMEHVARKITDSGNPDVMICERGTSFGYNTLVTDFRGLPTMGRMGHPVIFDATHSVQQPGGQGGKSGGQSEFVPVLARAAISLGVAGVFIESHNDPENAFSDGPNMVRLDEIEALLTTLKAFDVLAKSSPLKI